MYMIIFLRFLTKIKEKKTIRNIDFISQVSQFHHHVTILPSRVGYDQAEK